MTDAGVTKVPDITDETVSRFFVSIACGVYLVGYAGYSFGDALGPLRYLVYVVPPLLAASLTFQRAAVINRPAMAFLVAYLALVSVGALIGTTWGEPSLRNVIIISLIIFTFVPVIHVSATQISFVFFCSLIYLFLAYWTAGIGSIRILQMLQAGTGSAFQMGFDDNQGGLLGPLYAVFMYAAGAKLQFLLALLMSLLGGKRVGIVAILFGIAASIAFRNIAVLKQRRNRIAALLGVLGTINLVALNLNSISEYAHQMLGIKASIEEVMLGRFEIGSEMSRAMDARSLSESIFGFGPGTADALAARVTDGVLKEPHNDWNKILYEYGVAGSLLLTAFMAVVFSTSATAAALAVASAALMCTDNVLIYLFYQFPLVLMVAYAAPREVSVRKVYR